MALPVREINPTGFLNELDLSKTVKQSNKEDLYVFLDLNVLTKRRARQRRPLRSKMEVEAMVKMFSSLVIGVT